MTVYLINIFLILFWDLLIADKSKPKNRALFCGFSAFQWILVSGLRSLNVGPDTIIYANSFDRAGYVSWSTVFNAMEKVYLEGYEPTSSAENLLYKDPGYLLFQKICHIFTDSYQVYLIIVAVILFVLMARFICKYSDDPCISFILFSTLFYSFFAITGIRQSLATALVVFLGFDFVKERKLFKFALVAIFAFILHKSAIVFVPFYILGVIKINWKYIGTILTLTACGYAIGPKFILKAAELMGYNRDEIYDLPPVGYVMAIALVGLVAVAFHRRILKQSEDKKWELTATLLAAALSIFALIDQSMMRVQQYYSLFMMLSIPSIFNLFEKRSRALTKIVFIAIMVLYLMKNNPQYSFFWQ